MTRTILAESPPLTAIAAAQAPKPNAYVPPKTPWGDPDLQGLWPGSVNIPLQRARRTWATATPSPRRN